MKKHLLRPDRLRQVPKGFSWVDHRLVRDGHLDRCGSTSLALYLFLVTVSDVEGLSFYSDQTLCRRLRLSPEQFSAARTQLQQADLIAYQKPLYQVLSLDRAPANGGLPDGSRTGQSRSTAEILRGILVGAAA
jgi:hypothetical protein